MNAIGGIISLIVDGVTLSAKGDFTYNLGVNKREIVIGADGIAGYTLTPQPAHIEGAMTDSATLDLKALLEVNDATLYLKVANGKKIALYGAVFTGDGNVTTGEGEIAVRWDGDKAEEIS